MEIISEEDLSKLADSGNRNGKIPFQVALIDWITKGKVQASYSLLYNNNTLKFLSKLLKVDQKGQFIKAVNDKNDKGGASKSNNSQTPLHQLLQHIEEKSKKPSLEKKIQNIVKKDFKDTSRYKTLELLLQNGADITAQDKELNNAMHYIASLKGEQKVICLKLILNLARKGLVSKEKLSEAINATNKEERTPLQVALIRKAEKGRHLSQKNTIFDPEINYDNTTKLCATLLQNGANPNFLDLKDKKLHTNSYYVVLRDLKDYRNTPHTAQEKAREIKEQLEKKYNIKTFSGQLQSTAQSVSSSIKEAASNTEKALSAVVKYIDPASRIRELLVITVTVTITAMVAFALFQGQVGIEVAIPIIAVTVAVCLTLTFRFDSIKNLFEDLTDRPEKLVSNNQQKVSDQPEYKNLPNSQVSNIHIEHQRETTMGHNIECN